MKTWHSGFKVLRQTNQFGIYLEIYKGYKLILVKVVHSVEDADKVEREVKAIELMSRGV